MSAKLINVVLDLETLSLRENAAIIQIGCCIPKFDRIYIPLDGSAEFQTTIAYEIALNSEFHVDTETMYWWEVQSEVARQNVFSGQKSYVDAFTDFAAWIASLKTDGADVAIWGNGSDFDNRLLSYSLSAFGFKDVWNFRNNRDLRTLRALFPLIEDEYAHSIQIKHTALGDAIYEAELMDAIWYKHYKVLGNVL